METKYYKVKDGKFLKLDYRYNEYPESTLNPNFQTNLGTMVCKDMKNYALGNVQVKDWEEYFRSELSDEERFKVSCKFTINMPSVEEARNNPMLEKFIAGTEREGHYFDKPFFQQEIESMLSSIYIDDDNDIDLSAGIPVLEDENQKLSNVLEIDFDIPESKEESNVEDKLQSLINAVSENLNEYKLDWDYTVNKDSNLERMNEVELLKMWNEKKNFVCIPLSVYEHSGIAIHHGEEGQLTLNRVQSFTNGFTGKTESYPVVAEDGFMIVAKDNNEVLDYLKSHTEEETKKWAAGVLIAEIEEYNDYVQGFVYDATIYEFNPKTMDWDEIEGVNNIITSDMENWLKDYYNQSEPKEIHSQIIQEMMNTPTPEYKQAVFEKYVSKIKEIMPEFDGNLKHAASAATLSMKEGSATNLERTALSEYMKEKGCISPESTFKFLEESVGIKGKNLAKELNPLSFRDENLECVFSKIKNPNRSDNGGVNNALLIDYENRRFAYVSGASQMIDKPSETYLKKVEELSSKAVEKKLGTLVKAGFKNAALNSESLNMYRKDDKWISKYILKEPGRGI